MKADYELLMESRGYEPYGFHDSNRWSKLIGDIDNEDSFWIYAHIDLDKGIQLSSNTMKYLISLETMYFSINHPDFNKFENKLIKYIECCLQQDVIDEALIERQLNRRNKNTKK